MNQLNQQAIQPVQFINTELSDVIELKNIHQTYADKITGEDKIVIDVEQDVEML